MHEASEKKLREKKTVEVTELKRFLFRKLYMDRDPNDEAEYFCIAAGRLRKVWVWYGISSSRI